MQTKLLNQLTFSNISEPLLLTYLRESLCIYELLCTQVMDIGLINDVFWTVQSRAAGLPSTTIKSLGSKRNWKPIPALSTLLAEKKLIKRNN